MNIFVSFVLLFVAAEAVLTAVQLLLKKRVKKTSVHVILIVTKLLLAIALGALALGGPIQLRPVQPFMMASYVALFADGVADICYSLFCRISKKERKFALSKITGLVFGVAFLVFGILNMQTVTPKYHTYTSEKLMMEHKIVFLADLHVGSAQPFSVTEKTMEQIKAERPDALILGGDITDDYTTKEEMENTFALFADFGCPVYYVYGNHDRQEHADYAKGRQYTVEEFEKAMTDNGVLILRDSFAQIGSDVLLLGREDISAGEGRKKAEDIINPLPDAYLIVADHQPTQAKQNLAVGMDLQLSGHTHAGQLFPLKMLYAVIGKVHGDYKIGDAILNVSSGACGWRVPLRTEARCNYEVVTLKPAPRQTTTEAPETTAAPAETTAK